MEEPDKKQEENREEEKELVTFHEDSREETIYSDEYDEWGDVFHDARELVKNGNPDAAQEKLDSVEERSAEWHFIQSQIFKEKCWFLESKQSLKEAIKLDPENKLYKKELKKLDKMAKKGKRGRRRKGGRAMGVGDACGDGCGECCAAVGCELCCTFVCEGICEGCG